MPLFSLRGAGWGIGEIGDLGGLCAWLAAAGHHVLQLLPVNEVSPGERSPYAALSAFALDPIYLSLAEVEDFAAAGGEVALAPEERAALDGRRADPTIDYVGVRAVKRHALEVAFAHFLAREWHGDSARARALRRFEEENAHWLADYVVFQVCRERRARRSWRTWERSLRNHDPAAVRAVRAGHEDVCRFHAYVQWVAAEQWAAARRAAARAGVRLMGDLPFMVSEDSADVWAQPGAFSFDVALGAPPDAFNADGQNWGLPVCRWDVMAADGYAWLRARAGRAAALFDAFRLDHVVGLFRMFVIPPDGPGRFVPDDEGAQRRLGERLLGALQQGAAGAEVIGEDLGVVPAFVRTAMTRLGIPGYRVLRWEDDGGVFRDPAAYPALSVATAGTHDTSSLATWWADELDDGARRALAEVPAFRGLAGTDGRWSPTVHAILLDGLYGAGSDLAVLPFPDIYGGQERINVPATTGPANWSYRLPWTLAELQGAAGAEVRDRLHALAARHGRTGSG